MMDNPEINPYGSGNSAAYFIDRHIDEGRGDKAAIRTVSGVVVTYGELLNRIGQTSNFFLSHTPERGDRLLILMKDTPEFYFSFWGAIRAGLVPVPLNTLLTEEDYHYIIRDAAPQMILYSPDTEEKILRAVKRAGTAPVMIEHERFSNAIQDFNPDFLPVGSPLADTCFLLYTSGTTGEPKGVMHSHYDLVATARRYGQETLGMSEKDLVYSASKLFFAYGLGNSLSFPLWAGATTVIFDGVPTPEKVVHILEEYKPTFFFGFPGLYAALLKYIENRSPRMDHTERFVSAGEALPKRIFELWQEKFNRPILDGIGSTEALHIFISNSPDDVKPGSSGKPVSGYSAKIVDESGEETAAGEMGNLFVSGESLMQGYWNKEEKTRQSLSGGWLATGDKYYKDEEGYYYYCGRSDDMVKVSGVWYSPHEIESKLIEHPMVFEAAVVGKPDEDELIKPAAYVVLKDGAEASAEESRGGLSQELIALCKKELAPYKRPKWVYFVPELPKTATGKIRRHKLRQPS